MKNQNETNIDDKYLKLYSLVSKSYTNNYKNNVVRDIIGLVNIYIDIEKN